MSEYSNHLEQKYDKFVSELKKLDDDADLITKLAHDSKQKNETLGKYKEFFQSELDSEVKKCKLNAKKLKIAFDSSKKESEKSVKEAKILFDAAKKVFEDCKKTHKTALDNKKQELETAEESARQLRKKKTNGISILSDFIHKIQLCVKEKNNLDNQILCSSTGKTEETEETEEIEEAKNNKKSNKISDLVKKSQDEMLKQLTSSTKTKLSVTV